MAELKNYQDERSGAQLWQLVTGPSRNTVIDPAHPMWTPELDYFVFLSDRANPGEAFSPHALCMRTKRVFRMSETPTDVVEMGRKRGRLYYMVDRDLYALNISMMCRNVAGPRKVATLPKSIAGIAGGISVDAKEDALYAGIVLKENARWGLVYLDMETKAWRLVTETNFPIGHVQANPAISGVVLFCHAMEGNAPQRMWMVKSNGTEYRPFYRETYGEWVMQEVWWGGLRALFTVWPYDDERRAKPFGVLSADMSTGTPRVHSAFPARTVHGSLDGKWITADDQEGNIWVISAISGERRYLTGGHGGSGTDSAPLYPSFTPDNKAVVFNSSKTGPGGIMLAEMPAWESLPLA